MQPRPPAEDTAAARGAVLQWAMPARRMGWRMERRVVRGVVRGADIFAVESCGEGCVGWWWKMSVGEVGLGYRESERSRTEEEGWGTWGR
jgi:hypothetical protein